MDRSSGQTLGVPKSNRAATIALVAFVVLGATDGALGPLWPSMRDDFGRSDGHFGQIFAGLAGGYMVASALSGHLTDRFGATAVIRSGGVLAALAMWWIGVGSSWAATLLGFLALGLGNGLLDATINTWVAVSRGSRAMGLIHGFYGVGAAVGPLFAVAFVTAGDAWEIPFVILGSVQLAVVLATMNVPRGFDLPTTSDAASDDGVTDPADAARLLALMLFWFFLYVGAEVASGQWSFTLLTEARGATERAGGWFVSIYWAGLTVGRFAMAWLGDRITPEAVMTQASALAVLGAAVLAIDPAGVGAFALPGLGLAFSVMFPVVVNRTPAYLGTRSAARFVGYQFAAAALGAIVVPAVVGLAADRSSAEALGPIVVITCTGMAATWATVRGLVSRRAR